jgi:DNA-binding response OmpR family regulator
MEGQGTEMEKLRTILIVEDEADDAELIGYAFDKAGVQNPRRTLVNGDDAAAYMEGSAEYADRTSNPLPGLVLLDLKLPRRSGFEVLQVIRRDAATQHVPVIVLTSSDHQHDIERAYSAGANSYLVKPVTRESLLALVRSLDAYWIKLNRVVAA